MAVYGGDYPPTNPAAFAKDTGFDVGSMNSQDEFAGYGTAFNNPDRFVLEMKKNIHLISPNAAPFLSWATMVRKNPTPQITYSWMEDELFTHRDVKCKLVRDSDGMFYLSMYHGGDWQAFEAAALADALSGDFDPNKPVIYLKVTDGTTTFAVVPLAAGLADGPGTYTYTPDDAGSDIDMANSLIIMDYSSGAAAGVIGGSFGTDYYKQHCIGMVSLPDLVTEAKLTTMLATAGSVEVTVHVYTPDEQLQGYAQGSGLPNETRKRSRTAHNVTQIFKTPYSIANTLKAVELYGGPELARLRLRKTIQHKTELERAILFQGGGVEGTDWGMLPLAGYENPLTRFKGIGVGATNPGFIRTKNADLDTAFVLDVSGTPTMADFNALTYRIFDDTVDAPSSDKIVFASPLWLMALSEMALSSSSGAFVFGNIDQAPNALGVTTRKIITPNGNLYFVPMPLFRGQYELYALVVDFQNVEIRPLRGRDTQLHANVGGMDIDGQLDFLITEMGFELRHESTHCILKLKLT